ncbi:glycosyltransferase family 2 protein [Curtobacterium caseinilyticum]|uniref:Glycosyltransferase n=1 Tax=Curtobacterium caseinilyticum TaxID=3055137 RepID=A0ABT7TR18_9MICO|nr:glycosyltransferase [Curtobacterium caseinilyticum]MDM7891961.1 glycosyltransferase [Curtobacterium caseinilyticum]
MTDRREPSLTIVSVLYGGAAVLESTLPTWRDAVEASVEVVFVDHSPEPLKAHLDLESWARYVWNPDNPGFAAGVNNGVALAESERIFLLNPDVYLTRSAVESVMSLPDSGPYSVALRTDGIDHLGVEYSWWGFCRDRVDSERFLIGPSGGAAVFSTSLVRDEVPFPEHLFAWGEDAEWGLLLQSRGIETRALEEITLDHIGGHSVANPAGQRLKARLLVRNRIATFRRMLSAPAKCFIALPFFAAVAANGLRKVRQGTSAAYFRGVMQGLSMEVPAPATDRISVRQWRRITGRRVK